MKPMTLEQLSHVSGGYLSVEQGDCYQAKADAVNVLLGPEHYDVLAVTDSLHYSCPMEYPDKFAAFNAAIEPFMTNPMLL